VVARPRGQEEKSRIAIDGLELGDARLGPNPTILNVTPTLTLIESGDALGMVRLSLSPGSGDKIYI